MSRSRVAVVAAAVAVSCAAVLGAGSTSAFASRYIEQSSGFSCESRLVRVSPPKVHATYGTELGWWTIAVQRWNATTQRWYDYTSSTHTATFNYWGNTMYGWSGNRFHNNRMNVPVFHSGHYRVASAVAAPDRSSTVWVAGGSWCWMP